MPVLQVGNVAWGLGLIEEFALGFDIVFTRLFLLMILIASHLAALILVRL